MRASLVLLVVTATMACGTIRAEENPSPKRGGKLSLTTKRVVVFKDGHGLFIKQAEGMAGVDGKLFTDQLPDQASLGSFWVSDRDQTIATLIASRAKREQTEKLKEDCQNVFEVLLANRGKQARVVTLDDKIYKGVIRAVLEKPIRSSPGVSASLASLTGVTHYVDTGRSWTPAPVAKPAPPKVEIRSPQGAFFVLGTEDGDELIPVAAVRTLRVTGMRTKTERLKVTSQDVKLLTVEYKKPRPGRKHKLDLMYFRPGIRWIPTYRIDLGDDGLAELVMQAEVINEAEDFEDTAVDFVVGLPTFRFQDVPSPLSLERVMLNALSQAVPQLAGQLAVQQFSNAAFNDRSRRAVRPQPVSQPGPDVAVSAMDGSEVQDLYYYSTRRMSLKRGERAAVEVLRVRVPYRHLYTWDLSLGRSHQDVHTGYRSPLKLTTNKVWHQVVLVNKAGRPWTTGPAMLLQDGLPVGQDMLTFTPAGREVMVPLTAAVSVRGTVDEKELSRSHGARKIRSRSYTRVKNQATFQVVNSLKVPVKLVVQAEVSGRATEASDGGSLELLGLGSGDAEQNLLNQRSEVSWTMTLRPGETKRVQAAYHFYLRE